MTIQHPICFYVTRNSAESAKKIDFPRSFIVYNSTRSLTLFASLGICDCYELYGYCMVIVWLLCGAHGNFACLVIQQRVYLFGSEYFVSYLL